MKTKMADTSPVSRVRTTAGTRRNNSYKHSENNKKATGKTNWELFCMNNKTVNSAFVSYEELWRSRRVLSVEAIGRGERITPSSLSIILHKILSLIR